MKTPSQHDVRRLWTISAVRGSRRGDARLSPEPECPVAAAQAGCRVEVRATERDSFTEYHVTGTVGGTRTGPTNCWRRWPQPWPSGASSRSRRSSTACRRPECLIKEARGGLPAGGMDLSVPSRGSRARPCRAVSLLVCRSGHCAPRQQDRRDDGHECGDGSRPALDWRRLPHAAPAIGSRLKPGGALAGDAPAQADQMFTTRDSGSRPTAWSTATSSGRGSTWPTARMVWRL